MSASLIQSSDISEDNVFFNTLAGEPSEDNVFSNINMSLSADSRQQQQQAVQGTLEEIEEKGWDLNDTTMTFRAFTDGLWLNKSEEIGTYLSAAAFKALNPDLAGGKTIKQIRDEMLAQSEAESAAFMEERPVASTAANIAGAILSPASLKAGQVLGATMQARNAATAAQSQATAQSVIQGSRAAQDAAMASSQLASQYSSLAPTAYNLATKTPKAVQAAALAAAEGGVIGYEGVDPVQSAATSAAISGVIPFGFAGISKSAEAVAKTRVWQELGEGENFINLMYTESGLNGLYRTVVAKTFGAKTLAEQQMRQFTQRMPSSTVLNEQAVKYKENAKLALGRAFAVIGGKREDALEYAKEVQRARTLELKQQKLIDLGDLGDPSKSADDYLNGLTTEEIKEAAVREADAAVNAITATFRSSATRASAPSGVSAEELADLESLDPQAALRMLDDLWQRQGFRAAKNKTYDINSDTVLADLDSLLKNDAEAYLALKQSGSLNTVFEFVGKVLTESVEGGRIAGEDLVSMRSRIGTLLNGLSDDKTLVRGYIDNVQTYIDDLIVKQLDPKAAQEFTADRSIWLNKLLVENATTRATGGNKASQGAFSADDWLESVKVFGKNRAARGTSPLQQEAVEASALARQRDLLIKRQANEQIKETLNAAKQTLRADRDALAKQRQTIQSKYLNDEAAIKADYEASAKTAKDKAVKEERLASVKQKHEEQLLGLEEQKKVVAAQTKWIAENSAKTNVSIFEQLFSSQLLAAPITLAAGATAGGGAIAPVVIGGIGAGRALISEGTQRFAAGQTKAQRNATILLDSIRDSAQRGREAGVSESGVGAVVGEGQRQKLVVTPEVRKALMGQNDRRKAATFEGMLARKQAEVLRIQDPTLYKELKRAYDNR